MKRLIGSLVLVASATLTVNPVPAAAGAAGPIRLRVMSFNIQYGAKLSPTGLHAVVDAIRAADADVVGLQEPFGNTRRIAHMLGWHAAPRLHLVSRYPIVFPVGSRSPGNAGGHIPEGLWGYLLLGGGSVAAVANTHTPSSPDGVKLMMQGADRSQVLAVERRVRVSWVQPHLDATSGPIADGIPTFFTGDFNSPSHLDWTPAAVGALGWQPSTIDPPGRRYAVRWPVTVAMEQAGYRDSFREAHPDPIATPAFTYCVTRYPACAKWDSWDRIDYVFAAGPSTTVHSRIVGEGGPYTDIVSRPWPTDHRSVVSVFDVQRVTPPDFAAPTVERVFVGRTVHVAFHAAAAPDRSIGLWARGDDPSAGPAAALAAVGDSEADGSVSVDTAGLTSGSVHRRHAGRRRERAGAFEARRRRSRCPTHRDDLGRQVCPGRPDPRELDGRNREPLRLAGAQPRLLRSHGLPAPAMALHRRTRVRVRELHAGIDRGLAAAPGSLRGLAVHR